MLSIDIFNTFLGSRVAELVSIYSRRTTHKELTSNPGKPDIPSDRKHGHGCGGVTGRRQCSKKGPVFSIPSDSTRLCNFGITC